MFAVSSWPLERLQKVGSVLEPNKGWLRRPRNYGASDLIYIVTMVEMRKDSVPLWKTVTPRYTFTSILLPELSTAKVGYAGHLRNSIVINFQFFQSLQLLPFSDGLQELATYRNYWAWNEGAIKFWHGDSSTLNLLYPIAPHLFQS